MTTQQAVELSLPVQKYHLKCRYEMEVLKCKRRKLTEYIERRKAGVMMTSPMLLKIDLQKVWEMVNN